MCRLRGLIRELHTVNIDKFLPTRSNWMLVKKLLVLVCVALAETFNGPWEGDIMLGQLKTLCFLFSLTQTSSTSFNYPKLSPAAEDISWFCTCMLSSSLCCVPLAAVSRESRRVWECMSATERREREQKQSVVTVELQRERKCRLREMAKKGKGGGKECTERY